MAKPRPLPASMRKLHRWLHRLRAAPSPSRRQRRRTASTSTSRRRQRQRRLRTADLTEMETEHVKGVALGHHGNVMPRHRKLLTDIGSLIPHLPNVEINDDRVRFLKKAASSYVIYMEWVDKDECVYLWIGDRKRMIKLELHAVFESSSESFGIQNPILSFSCGFEDDKHWKNLKSILVQIFGSSQDKNVPPDYLYAFTRLGEILHVQIYEVLGIDQSSLQNEMKLMKKAPTFSMRPIEVKSAESYLQIFYSKRLMCEESSLLNLEQMSGFVPANGSLIKHTIDHLRIPNVLFLPCPQDVSRLNGFNSDLTEFLQRYPATYQDVVPGSSPETEYRDITDTFRLFSRSLILIVGAAIERKLCIRGLSRENILIKRGVARLHNVELLPYRESRALIMFRRIRRILKGCMPEGIPADVGYVLGLLKDSPLKSYDQIAHSPVWIPAWDRCHYLEDTYSVFKSDLHLEFQIKFAETKIQSLLENWRGKMEQNNLLYDVVNHNERMPRGYANKSEEDQEKDREHVKNRKIEALRKIVEKENIIVSDNSLCSLLTCQEFFAKCRHSVVHLPEAAVKLGLPPMPPEKKNLVISCEFAAVYPLIQEGLCEVKLMTPEELGLTKYFKTDVTSDLL